MGQLLGEAGRYPLDLGRIHQRQSPAIGGIKHLVAEAGGELGQLLAGLVEGGLNCALQAHTAQLHVPQFRRQDPLLGAIEPARGADGGGLVLALEGLQGLENHLALAGPAAELNHRGLLAGMGEPQVRAIADAVEVADHSPAPTQLLAEPLQRVHDFGPIEQASCAQGLAEQSFKDIKLRVKQGEQLGNVLFDLGRSDLAKGRQALAR